MNLRKMIAASVVGMVLSAGGVVWACEPGPVAVISPAEKEGELAFASDGNDLVVSMMLTINGSAHVAMTDSSVDPASGEVKLAFTVVQNADRLLRCQKKIALTWRLVGRVKGNETYRASGAVMMLKGEQIKGLGGKFAAMAG